MSDETKTDAGKENPEEQKPEGGKNSISNSQAFFNLAKALFGTGVFSLPYGFKFAGYAGGTIGLLILAVICSYSMIILVNAQIKVKEKRQIPFPPYGKTLEYALEDGPKWSTKLSRCSNVFVVVVILIHQIGVCIIYYQFCVRCLKMMIETHSTYKPEHWHVVLWLMAPFILLMLIKNTKYIAPFSLAGNLSLLISLIIIFYYMCLGLPPISKRSAFLKQIGDIPLFIGTVQYAFTAIGVILPVVGSMKTPENLTKFFGAWNLSIMIACGIYISFGMIGYLKYGESIKEVIILIEDLPKKWPITLARGLCIFALSINFPLNGIYFTQIIMQLLEKTLERKVVKIIIEYTFRIVIVLISVLVTVFIPKVVLLINLVGNACIPFAIFLFPAWLDYLVNSPDNFGKFKWRIPVDILIALFSVVVLATGTYLSILEIVREFQGKN